MSHLVTLLCTGNYQPITYFWGQQQAHVTYIQSALAHFLRPEAMTVLMTQQAQDKHWQQLQSELPAWMPEGCQLDCKVIPFGADEAETWQIFEVFAQAVAGSSAVTVDITHSFRSHPVLMLATLQYLRCLEDIHVAHICYGNYEAHSFNQGQAPVLDLRMFVDLMDWSQAVASWSRYGHFEQLEGRLEQAVVPRLKASQGQDEEAKTLRYMGSILHHWHEQMSTSRLLDIAASDIPGKLCRHIKALQQEPDLANPFYYLLDKLNVAFEDWQRGQHEAQLPPDIQRGLQAAYWCADHHMLLQAYTLLMETLTSGLCYRYGLDAEAKDDRIAITNALGQVAEGQTKKPTTLIRALQRREGTQQAFLGCFDKLRKRRNDLMHGGTTEEPTSPDKLRRDFADAWAAIKEYLAQSPHLDIINLTQHQAVPQQQQSGIFEPPSEVQTRVRDLLTFETPPSAGQLQQRASELAQIAEQNQAQAALIGGAPFLLPYLEKALWRLGIQPAYAFSQRQAQERHKENGEVVKELIFMHEGLIWSRPLLDGS